MGHCDCNCVEMVGMGWHRLGPKQWKLFIPSLPSLQHARVDLAKRILLRQLKLISLLT